MAKKKRKKQKKQKTRITEKDRIAGLAAADVTADRLRLERQVNYMMGQGKGSRDVDDPRFQRREDTKEFARLWELTQELVNELTYLLNDRYNTILTPPQGVPTEWWHFFVKQRLWMYLDKDTAINPESDNGRWWRAYWACCPLYFGPEGRGLGRRSPGGGDADG